MVELKLYDQVLSGSFYKESLSRRTILPTGTDLLNSGIHILYSPESTGTQNSVFGLPAGEIPSKSSVILGGNHHELSTSTNSVVLGGNNNRICSAEYGGGDNNSLIGGSNNYIETAKDSFIIGGSDNYINPTWNYSDGVGILNSACTRVTSQNSTVINVTSGEIVGKNNVSLAGHNILINGNNNFTVGANLSVFGENIAIMGDGRRPYEAHLCNALYLRYTNGAIFTDFINIKSDNTHSPLFGPLGESLKRNRNVDYFETYGGTAYLDGDGAAVGDISGINLSVGFKSMPIIIGERATGPIFADWSGVVSGVVYRIPSNAIHIGYDNSYNVDDTVIGDHNVRMFSKERSLDKNSDPFSRRAIIIGSDNAISGTNQIVGGQVNKINAATNTIIFGNYNTAHGTSQSFEPLTGANGLVTGYGPSNIIFKGELGEPITAEYVDDLVLIGSYNTEYIGKHSSVIGSSNSLISQASNILGNNNFLSGFRTSIIGAGNSNWGDASTIAGTNNRVRSHFSSIIGSSNNLEIPFERYSGVLPDNSVLGNYNWVVGRELSVVGTRNVLRNYNHTGVLRNSLILGNNNLLSSAQSIIIGYGNEDYSNVFPNGNFNSYVFGDANYVEYSDMSLNLGFNNKIYRSEYASILGGTRNSLLSGKYTSILGNHGLGIGSNQIIFGSYTKGQPRFSTPLGLNTWNQGLYQRVFLNWKGYWTTLNQATIELTLDGIKPTGSYNQGRALMEGGKMWNGLVNVVARRGFASSEIVFSQLRHLTILKDQGDSTPRIIGDAVLSTQTSGTTTNWGVSFAGNSKYLVVNASGNYGTFSTNGTPINWHVTADFAETNLGYDASEGAVVNEQRDSNPNGYFSSKYYV